MPCHHHLGVIESFSLGGALIDTLRQIPDTARRHGIEDDFGTATLLMSLFDNPSLMALWSPKEAEALMQQDLPPVGNIEPNDGSGRFRPNFIRSLVDTEASVDENALTGLHLESLALLATQGSQSNSGDDAIQKAGKITSLVQAAIEGWGGAVLATVQSMEKEGAITQIKINRLFSAMGASIKHASKELTRLRLLSRDGVQVQDFTIIGVHGDGLHYGMTREELAGDYLDRKNAYLIGDILEENNGRTKVVASTSKTNMSKIEAGPVTKVSGEHSVFAIPTGHKMATQLTANKINIANGIHARINSEGVSKLFLGFALYNLRYEISGLIKSIKNEKEVVLSIVKTGNTLIDTLAASMKLTEVLLGNDHKFIKYGIQRPLFTVERTPLIGKRLTAVGGNTLVKTAALVNFAAGSIGVGISAYEVYHSYNKADYDAAFAHSVALAGGIVFLSSPMLATCLAIPGWGWAVLGMGMILGGGLWAASASDGLLEQHLKQGPFGIASDPSVVSADDTEYYPQLLSLLSPFQLSACRVADAATDDAQLQAWLQKSDNQPDDMLISLNSALISQFPSWKSDGLTITAQELQYSTLETSGTRASYLSKQTPLVNLKSTDFLPGEHAIRFVVGKQLKAGTHTTALYRETTKIRLRLCIQVRIKSELGEHVMPHPLQKKDLPYNPAKHAAPPPKQTRSFINSNQDQTPFWFIKEMDI